MDTARQAQLGAAAVAALGATAVLCCRAPSAPTMEPEPEPEAPCSPTIVVVWGGIGVGKSTGTALLLQALRLPDGAFVKVGVDDLVELIPEYRAAVEAGDPARKEAAYMQYRNEAKKLKAPTLAAAIERKQPIYLEWTYDGNLEKFANGEDAELPDSGYISEAGYDVVLLYVACPDVEGIVRNAAKRERTIPEATVRKWNLNRTKPFVDAANSLQSRLQPSAFRAFVMERPDADSQGVLREVTAMLPLPGGAEPTEEEVWAAVQARLAQGAAE